VVNLCLCTEQLLLASLVGKVTTDLITVFFCLQHGDQVDTRPHLFASEFAVRESVSFEVPCFRVEGIVLLLFTDTLTNAPETVGADGADHDEVGGRTETAGGQVALVLDGLVAAGGRHILRHDGRRMCCVYVGVWKEIVESGRSRRGGIGNWWWLWWGGMV
jgi:hypothetical protein